ncbi:MAG: hypothetical protein WC799_18130 [Desulfobacteraceae bacterium]
MLKAFILLKAFYHTDGFLIAWAFFYHADSFEFLPVAFMNLTDGCLCFVFYLRNVLEKKGLGLVF